MEDEQGAVGQGSSGGASASPLSDNLPSESHVENLGSDNQVQESYEEGDGEEIMVEVVGSDVYVDGVGAHLESGEVGDIGGRVVERIEGSETHNLSKAMGVSNEGDGIEVKESDLGLSELRDKKHVVTEEVDDSFSKSVDDMGDEVIALPSRGGDVVNDEVWNPGIEAMDGSSSGVSVPDSEVAGPSPMVISDEKRTEDEGVTKDSSDLETPESLDHPAEAVVDEKADTKEKKELLPSSDNSASCGHFSLQVSVPNEEVSGPSPMAISEEEKTEHDGVSKGSSDLVTPETVNYPTEAILDKKSDPEEKKHVLPLSDISARCGLFSLQVSVPNEEVPGPSPMVISEEEKTEHDGVSKGSSDLVTPETVNYPTEAILDKKSDPEEKKHVLPLSDISASCGLFSLQVSVPNEEVPGPSPMEISEEKKTEDDGASKGSSDLVTPDTLNYPAEAVLDKKSDLEEKKHVLPSNDISASCGHVSSKVSMPTKEVMGPSSAVFSEEKKTEDEAVNKDGVDLVTPEPLNHPAEDALDEKADLGETEEVLPASDISASCDHLSSAVSLPTEDVTGPSTMVICEEKRTEEDVLDEKADLAETEEVLPATDISASRDHLSSAVSLPTEDVTGPSTMVISEEKRTEEDVLDEKADLAETEELLPATDISASSDHLSSAVSLPTEDVTGPATMVISEEKRTEDEAVHKESADLVTPEHLNHPAESVFDKKEEAKEVLLPGDDSASGDHFSSAASVLKEEVTELSPVVISEEKKTEDGTVYKESAGLVTPEALNHPAEAVSDEKADIEENKEVLPSSDSSASRDHTDGDSVMSHEETEAAQGVVEPPEVSLNPNCVGPQNVQVDGIDIVVGEVHLVNTSAGGEPLDPGTQEDERATTDGDGGIDRNSVDEKEKFAAENTGSILESDALVSDIQDASQGSLNELNDVKLGSDDRVYGVSHACPESIHDNSFVSKRGEAIGDECLKDDGDLETHEAHENLVFSNEPETHEAHENQVFSNEPDQLTDGGDTADKDKCLNAEIQNDIENNETNATSLSCPSYKEIMQADSDMCSDQPFIATMTGAEIDDQDAVISQEDAADSGGSSEKVEKINPEITKTGAEIVDQDAAISQEEAADSGGSSEKGEEINPEIPALDDFAENMHIQEEGACSKVEAMDVKAIEDDVVCHNPIVNSQGFVNVVEECGSPQSTKQEVSVQITESSNHEVDKIENNNLTPNEVASISAVSDTTEKSELLDGGDIKEKPGCGTTSSSNEDYKSREEDHEPRESNGFCTVDGHTSETKVMDVEEEIESDQTYHGGPEDDAELGSEGPSSETDKLKSIEEKVKYASSLRMEQSGYLTPPENEGGFAQSDLVWGKVRSHPWWPGQIFDPADASEKALKYHKKDSYLVAYFGDQTFAWNDSSALKPFRSHFSQIEKQSNSESFHNAVSCALEEVERRVELGLACSCIPDAYAKIETQVVENTGIREEASQRHGVDESSRASHFEPDKLLDYVKGLAPRASSRADRLDLVIARAQLSAFCRFKGYRSTTEFPSPGELLGNDADTERASDEMAASKKRRHIPKDGSQSRNERNSVELVGDREYSPDAEDELVAEEIGKSISLSSGKKRKAVDHPVEGSDKRVTVHAAKISTSASQTPKPSFKIGECIRRVASQLTGSTSSVKGSNDETVIDASSNIYEQSEKQIVVAPTESLSVNEMLSQLELLAQDPKKRHCIQNNIRAFFLGYRSSVVLNRRGRKKRSEQTKGGSGEEFEFDDVNDSYWTDRIVQNYSEEQILHDSENADKNLQLVPFGAEKPVKSGRKSHSRKRFSSGISPSAASEEDENIKRRKQESSPAELILNFAERNCVPSEINLNKMFRRFGPLMESETEVDHELGCAKVIFKRGSDAEVAQNSAEKFNIFGPVLVDYQIGYSPVISVKVLPIALPQPLEDAAMML